MIYPSTNPELVKQLSEKWQQWAKDNYVLPIDGRDWDQRVKTSK